MNILLDLNVVIDFLIPKRKGHELSKKVHHIIIEQGFTLWMSASSVSNIWYMLAEEARKYGANLDYVNLEFKRYVQDVKIFSVTGSSVREAINSNVKDFENHIIYTNFKRIAPDGLIVSNDKNFGNYDHVLTPQEFIDSYGSLRKSTAIPLLDLKQEYRYMLEDIDNALLKNIADAKYILGPEVRELEQKIAEYLGVKHCIGCSSGTEALVLSLRALAIKTKGKEYFDRTDKIITTPFTFTATGDAILRAGATPVFVDIDPKSFNIDPDKIRKYLSMHYRSNGSRVVGIVPVHLYGHPCHMDQIMEIAREYDLFVVEDVAQAFGGMWKGQKLGSIGHTGAFSFFPSKNLGGFGDGGMVATKDEEIAELVRMLIKHGGKDKYNVEHIGYNARLDTIQAAILLAKLKHIDEFNQRRRKIAQIYNQKLEGLNVGLPIVEDSNVYHVYHQYTIRVPADKRDKLQGYLKANNVSTMVYYPVPLHKMKVFEGRCEAIDIIEAEVAPKEVLSLPIEPLLTEEEIDFVCTAIREFEW